MSKNHTRPLSSGEISLMCRQLSMLVKSGVQIYEAFEIMENTAADKRDRALYAQVREELENGERIEKALEQTGRFPSYMVRMIGIGDKAGKLDTSLDSLYLYYQRSEETERSVRSAVIYPLIMVAVMICVVAFLIIKALPIFAQVFLQVGAEMPAFLKALTTGNSALKVLLYIGIIAAVIVIAYFLLKQTVGGENLIAGLYENGFATKKLAEKSNTNKFTYAMSMLLSSGVNIEDAVNMAEELIKSPGMLKKTEQLKKMLENNEPFAASLTKCGLLSGEYAAMLSVAEKAGKLDEMMNTIAERSARDADEWINNFISSIEPTIVIVMSLVIGLILVSVMLPLMDIMTSI